MAYTKLTEEELNELAMELSRGSVHHPSRLLTNMMRLYYEHRGLTRAHRRIGGLGVMSYREYQRMIGMNVPDKLPDGVTFEDFKVDEGSNSWYATLYRKDGKPYLIQLYVWSGGLSAVWEHIKCEAPDEVEHRGNGHYTASWGGPD